MPPRTVDAAAGTPVPSGWSRFDISLSLATLRTGSHAAEQVELRKLHIRWWHAGPEHMR